MKKLSLFAFLFMGIFFQSQAIQINIEVNNRNVTNFRTIIIFDSYVIQINDVSIFNSKELDSLFAKYKPTAFIFIVNDKKYLFRHFPEDVLLFPRLKFVFNVEKSKLKKIIRAELSFPGWSEVVFESITTFRKAKKDIKNLEKNRFS